MTEVVEVRTEPVTDGGSASVDTTSCHGDDAVKSVVQLGDATPPPEEKGDRGVEVTVYEPAMPPPCEPSVVGGPVDAGSSSHVDGEAPKEADDELSSGKCSVERSVAAAAVNAPAKPGDTAAGADAWDRATERSRPSTSGGRPAAVATQLSSAARHALPSAVAGPRATGKHRLPPVLVTTAGCGGGGLERTSPLPLAVAATSSTSLTGGTRLGDLGLSQPPPPLNLSTDEVVNMKLVSSTATQQQQRSAADSGNCTAGMMPCCYSAPDRGAQSIGMSVCLCVCLSAIISSELHVRSSPNFCACYLWPWLGPPLTAK